MAAKRRRRRKENRVSLRILRLFAAKAGFDFFIDTRKMSPLTSVLSLMGERMPLPCTQPIFPSSHLSNLIVN